MLFGNARAVLGIVAIPLVKAYTGSDTVGIRLLAGLLVLGAAIVVSLRESRRVSPGGQEACERRALIILAIIEGELAQR